MTIVRVHEAWCDSPNHSYTGTEIVKARGVQLVKVALRGRGWVCSNDNTNAICPECVAKAKQPRMETRPSADCDQCAGYRYISDIPCSACNAMGESPRSNR